MEALFVIGQIQYCYFKYFFINLKLVFKKLKNT